MADIRAAVGFLNSNYLASRNNHMSFETRQPRRATRDGGASDLTMLRLGVDDRRKLLHGDNVTSPCVFEVMCRTGCAWTSIHSRGRQQLKAPNMRNVQGLTNRTTTQLHVINLDDMQNVSMFDK
jgi:hypothetical protein